MQKISFIFLLIFVACTKEESSKLSEKPYFDLTSFVNNKVKQLTGNQYVITKKVSINGKSETISTEKINWKKELELFSEADINKQAFQKSYDKVETPYLLSYSLKNTEDLPVKSLKIELDSLLKAPKKIEVFINVHNYLYDSDKHLEMNLQNGKLKHYKIVSSQELFWGSKKDFLIEGEVKTL